MMIWALIIFSLTMQSPVRAMIEVLRDGRMLPSRIAEFGPRIQMDGLTGILLPVELLDEKGSRKGCEVLKTPPVLKVNSVDVPWIALVERGGCTFLEKVKAMQESGASGVIVGGTSDTNLRRGGGLIRMSAGEGEEEKAKSIRVPSAYVMKWEYEVLQEQLHSDPEDKAAARVKTVALMQDGRKVPHLAVKMMPDAFDDMPLLNVTVVLLLLPMLMVLGLWGIWQCRNGGIGGIGGDGFFGDDYESIYLIPQRYRARPEEMPASLAAVNNLPRTHFDPQARGPNEPDLCAICLDDFVLGDELRKLPCKHEFHVSCIDPWLLTRKRFCPVCKGDACPNCLHSRAISTAGISNHVDLTIPDNVSTSSIILDPSPTIIPSTVNYDNEEALGEEDSLLNTRNDSIIRPSPPNSANLQPRKSLLSSVFERAWKSSTSVLLSPRSPRSSRNSLQPPFPVVDPDDYESARQLALNNRSRSSTNNNPRG